MFENEKPCGWKCGETGEHKHYAVLVRERGKLLGRLCPDGSTTKRNVYAAILSKGRAEAIAADINAGIRVAVPGLTAKVVPF